jgi:two-component system osmolarity sensor histidine kinase EnvZ
MRLSLFARLLLAQAGLVVALLLVVGGLFYIDRTATVAVLYADHWAPDLARAAGLPQAVDVPGTVLRRDTEPEAVRRPAPGAPRFSALRRALIERGVPVDDIRIGLGRAEPRVWLHVAPAGRPAVWLGVSGHMLVPEWSGRALLALLLTSALLVGVSWTFTRRLTRPLERLRARMTTQQLGTASAAEAVDAASTMTPEIAAIDAAYAELLARFERHERERAVLLAGVSHDLRSPLGRIRMAVELLPDGPDAAAKKASIVRNVAEADRLIESFLDYVRSGEAPLDETVDLAAAGRAVVTRFERPAAELRLEAPAALPMLPRANRLLVERVMANLIDNALKHGHAPVSLRLGSGGGPLWIEVEDAGPGIAPQQAERLQEAFVRGDGSRSSPGTGLGLAIVRQAVLRLGGSVSFNRACVRVTLQAR